MVSDAFQKVSGTFRASLGFSCGFKSVSSGIQGVLRAHGAPWVIQRHFRASGAFQESLGDFKDMFKGVQVIIGQIQVLNFQYHDSQDPNFSVHSVMSRRCPDALESP